MTERDATHDALVKAASAIRDAFNYDPGHSDLDNEQPIHISTTLGAWRRLNHALFFPKHAAELDANGTRSETAGMSAIDTPFGTPVHVGPSGPSTTLKPDYHDDLIDECAEVVEKLRTNGAHVDNQRGDAILSVAADAIRAIKFRSSVRSAARRITSAHVYFDALDEVRVAIRYADDTEDDRPATALEAVLGVRAVPSSAPATGWPPIDIAAAELTFEELWKLGQRLLSAAPNLAGHDLVDWLKSWWSLDEMWRDSQRKLYGPDVAHLMRGVADMIERCPPPAEAEKSKAQMSKEYWIQRATNAEEELRLARSATEEKK